MPKPARNRATGGRSTAETVVSGSPATGPPTSQTDTIASASAALFRAAPIPAWVYDLETLRFLEVNDAAIARYGWSRDEFLTMTIVDIRPPEDEARLRENVAGVSAGLDQAGVWRHRTRSNESIDVEIHSHTLTYMGRPAELVFVHDVSARLRHERRLLDNRDRLRALVSALPGVVFMIGEDGTYIEGAGEEDLLAAPVREVVGKNVRDFFGPAEREGFIGVIRRAIEADRTLDHSYELEVAGKRLWFEARVSPLRTPVQGRRAVVWVAWDVTERHRATEALRESETRLRTILDSEPECVKVMDLDGRLESMNPAGLRMLGVSHFGDLGDLGRFIAEHDRGRFMHLTREAAAGNPGELSFDAVREDGAPLRLHSMAVPMRDAAGHPVAVLAITRDITEAHRMSVAMDQQRELLRNIFDFMPVMIAVFEEGARLTFPNRAFSEALGWSAEELTALEDPLAHIFRSPGDLAAARTVLLAEQAGWRELDSSTADGRTLRVAWTAIRLSDGRRICLGQDVTERHRLEAQAWQSQKLESLGRLAGGVAHDFNNMLTVILGYLDLLATRPADDATREDLANIREAALRARDVTAQLLAFGRRQVTRRKVTSLARVVRDLEPLLRRVLGERIQLDVRPGDGDHAILADPAQIEQILMNLVLNSRDAMPDGGRLTIDLKRIHIEAANAPTPDMAAGATVLMTVSDTGHGMDAMTLERIFEPFFSTKGLAAGTGLGLATVYGAVQQNGGAILAASEPGAGTTFSLYFPEVERVPAERARDVDTRSTERGRGESILVVEDDDSVRAFLVRVLQSSGYAPLEADSVEAAIEAIRRADAIDLVITDVVMGDGSGLDVVRYAERIHPRARHIYASGYADDDDVRALLVDPGVNYLQKPFTPDVLLARIRELLPRR